MSRALVLAALVAAAAVVFVPTTEAFCTEADKIMGRGSEYDFNTFKRTAWNEHGVYVEGQYPTNVPDYPPYDANNAGASAGATCPSVQTYSGLDLFKYSNDRACPAHEDPYATWWGSAGYAENAKELVVITGEKFTVGSFEQQLCPTTPEYGSNELTSACKTGYVGQLVGVMGPTFDEDEDDWMMRIVYQVGICSGEDVADMTAIGLQVSNCPTYCGVDPITSKMDMMRNRCARSKDPNNIAYDIDPAIANFVDMGFGLRYRECDLRSGEMLFVGVTIAVSDWAARPGSTCEQCSAASRTCTDERVQTMTIFGDYISYDKEVCTGCECPPEELLWRKGALIPTFGSSATMIHVPMPELSTCGCNDECPEMLYETAQEASANSDCPAGKEAAAPTSGTYGPNSKVCYAPVCKEIQGGGEQNRPGSGEGDPHFVGFDGSKYDYDGIPGAVFSVLQTADVAINAHLVQHDVTIHHTEKVSLTYMDEIGISAAGARIMLLAGAGKIHVEVNNAEAPAYVEGQPRSIRLTDETSLLITGDKSVELKVPGFVFDITLRHDKFLDIRRAAQTQEFAEGEVHGVLGQTAVAGRDATNGVVGEDADYFVGSLWDYDFKYGGMFAQEHVAVESARFDGGVKTAMDSILSKLAGNMGAGANPSLYKQSNILREAVVVTDIKDVNNTEA